MAIALFVAGLLAFFVVCSEAKTGKPRICDFKLYLKLFINRKIRKSVTTVSPKF